jgi:hypothetical protein
MITSKFKIGDKVKCYREDSKYWYSFDFEGEVLGVNNMDDEVEYSVSNAPLLVMGFPCLIWESEMKLIDNSNGERI